MRRIILTTPKAIALDKAQPGRLTFAGAGTVIDIPSAGVTSKQADAWLKDGTAQLHRIAR
ncbi:MAG: hypothetical protein BGP16_05545 [Sphingobium sp. 66-54]|nr:MAG: hypothetical protein BGP16_05545 [Sphingobium sp. 66-54]